MESTAIADWPVFIGVTLVILGFAAFMTGRALAGTWRPVWWTVLYVALLGLVDRFLHWSLFQGDLLSPLGYVVDTAVLLVIALASYRMTQASKMAQQYPWLYQRAGLFSWRMIAHGAESEASVKNSSNLERN